MSEVPPAQDLDTGAPAELRARLFAMPAGAAAADLPASLPECAEAAADAARFGPPWAGVCISGGGSRSLSAAMGELRGLEALGVLPQIGWLSTVSGGTWAGTLFSWAPGIYSDAELLGPLELDPSALRWDEGGPVDDLGELDPHAIGSAATRLGLEEMLAKAIELYHRGVAASELWPRAIGELVLEPFDLGDSPQRYFTWTPGWLARGILADNPGLRASDFLLTRPDRPYLITNSTLFYPPNPPDDVARSASAPRRRRRTEERLGGRLRLRDHADLGRHPARLPQRRRAQPRPAVELGPGRWLDRPVRDGQHRPLDGLGRRPLPRADAAQPIPPLGRRGSVERRLRLRPARPRAPARHPLPRRHGAGDHLLAGLPRRTTSQERRPPLPLRRRRQPREPGNHGAAAPQPPEGHRLRQHRDAAHDERQRSHRRLRPPAALRPRVERQRKAAYVPIAADSPFRFNQVFDRATFDDLRQQLWHRAQAGATAMAVQTNVTVLANEHYGVAGGTTDLLWIYLHPVNAWYRQLHDTVKIAMDLEPLDYSMFPNYYTVDQLHLNARQVNLLAHLTSWNVASEEEVSGFPANAEVIRQFVG
jgi:hypothetical protein